MSLYVDTSALVKWYIPEPKSGDFETFIAKHPAATISRLTTIELRCALSRRKRNGEIDETYEAQAYRTFEGDIRSGHLQVSTIADSHFSDAVTMIDNLPDIPLRTLDALHLAAARSSGTSDFATADRIQAEAAQALGFTVHRFF